MANLVSDVVDFLHASKFVSVLKLLILDNMNTHIKERFVVEESYRVIFRLFDLRHVIFGFYLVL